MGKSSLGPYIQVHIPDVRNTKLLRIAKQLLVNGHHVEEGCQACRGRVEMLCLHNTGTMLYHNSLWLVVRWSVSFWCKNYYSEGHFTKDNGW